MVNKNYKEINNNKLKLQKIAKNCVMDLKIIFNY